IETAVNIEDLSTAEDVRVRLLPAEVILPVMERVKLNVEQEAMVRQGRSVRVLPEPGPGPVRAHDSGGRLVALGHTDPLRRTFVPEKVLSSSLISGCPRARSARSSSRWAASTACTSGTPK